jgi:HEAT repeat protein
MPRRKFRVAAAWILFCLGPVATDALATTRAPSAASSAARSVPDSAATPGLDEVAELVSKLKNQNDAADPKLVTELSRLKTREAVQGLIEVYDAMHTIFMRREIVRALIDFDGVAEAEQPALQKMMDIATAAEEVELRNAALDALGECKTHGKDFLMMIIDSPADDAVREKAMQLHVANANADDYPFYRTLYKPKGDDKAAKDPMSRFAKHDINKKGKDKDKKKEEDAGPKKPRSLEAIRLLAFQALVAQSLTPDELVEATKDDSPKLRAAAILGLESRGAKQALEVANATLEKSQPRDTEHLDKRLNELPEVRSAAAQVVGRLAGVKAAPQLTKLGLHPDTPAEVRHTLADILAGFNDPNVNRDMADKLARGHANEKYLALWAARSMQDDKLAKLIVKLLTDKDLGIVLRACETLAVRRDVESVPELQKLVDKSKDRAAIRAALDAMVVLRGSDPAWIDELVKLTKNDDPELRTLALTALGKTNDKAFVDKLAEALNDPVWSTRLAALEALERIHTREVIGPIIERLSKEEGRLQHEFIDVLWRMTGQPFDDNAEAWRNWWKANGQDFQPLSDEQVKKLEISEEEWRMKQTTHVDIRSFENPAAAKKTKFFGIRIISHQVLFIIDVSGSMDEKVAGEYDGKSGRTKMDIAKSELEKCILGLEPNAFFNIITFSSGVNRWFEGRLAAASAKNLDEAKRFVDKLQPLGGTNTYDALREAFKDPDVDTIFLMSDGEPTQGGVTDPVIIREHVKQWNEHRNITINTIAVGGQFQILEWLAEDSGGTHIKYE